jgi:hypothetical protein
MMTATKSECIQALREVADDIGHRPTRREYEKQKREGHPAYSAVYNYFEYWFEAIEAIERVSE